FFWFNYLIRSNQLVLISFLVLKVKNLQKIFKRAEKRRKELPLELKQKISYEIVQLLHNLGDNSSFAQQRGIFTFTFSYLVSNQEIYKSTVLCTAEWPLRFGI
uniref:Uncharacterized protein n=1 Tax=Oryza brachyantha TaxID=4533 RepID=J3LHC4_ORYBR